MRIVIGGGLFAWLGARVGLRMSFLILRPWVCERDNPENLRQETARNRTSCKAISQNCLLLFLGAVGVRKEETGPDRSHFRDGSNNE